MFSLSLIPILFIVMQAFSSKKKVGMHLSGQGEDGADLASVLNLNKDFTLQDVFSSAKEASKERKFREAIEVVLRLNVDPTKGG